MTIDGEPVKGADGRPVKAVGEDGDSFFEDVRQIDDEVIFILAGGETIRLPKAKEVNFVIERTTLTLKYGQTEKLAVTQKGVESYSISKPTGGALRSTATCCRSRLPSKGISMPKRAAR